MVIIGLNQLLKLSELTSRYADSRHLYFLDIYVRRDR